MSDKQAWNHQRLKCASCPFRKACEVRIHQRVLNRKQSCHWQPENEDTAESRVFAVQWDKHLAWLKRCEHVQEEFRESERLRTKERERQLEAQRKLNESRLAEQLKAINKLTREIQDMRFDSPYISLPANLSKEPKNPCGLCPLFFNCSTAQCSIPVRKMLCPKLFPPILKRFEKNPENWHPMKERPHPYFPN